VEWDYVTPKQRIGDVHLMDTATSALAAKTLPLINACCLYLGVTLLSDLTNAEGTNIPDHYFLGHPSPYHRHKGLFPYQDKTSWRRLLKLFLLSTRNKRLKRPLGRWLKTGEDLHFGWKALADPVTDMVYIRFETKFEVYRMENTVITYNSTTVDETPRYSVPIDVDFTGEHLTRHDFIPRTVSPRHTFENIIADLPDWEVELLEQHVITEFSVWEMTAQWRDTEKVVGTSDGSVATLRGSYG